MDMVPTAFQVPWRQSNKIMPANGTNLIPIANAGSTNTQCAPTKVSAVVASNNDTIAHDVIIGITDSTNTFTALGTVAVPINGGYVGAVPSVSLLSIPALPLDETGQPYIFLNPTDLLQVGARVAVNSGHDIDIITFGADF
jgi:hypothetical protein